MRFHRLLPLAVACSGAVFFGLQSPSEAAETKIVPTLTLTCAATPAPAVVCSWDLAAPAGTTRWVLLRNDGRAFPTPLSQNGYTDTRVRPGSAFSYLVWAMGDGTPPGVARSQAVAVTIPGAVTDTKSPSMTETPASARK